MTVPHEDANIFAVEVRDMGEAVTAINKTETAYLLLHIVPAYGDYLWLVFKDDSWARERWREHLPNARVLEDDKRYQDDR